MSVDKVHLNNLAFFAHHGVLPEETTLGQKFFLDLELSVDLSHAGKSDSIKDTICYSTVFEIVQHIVKTQHFKLIEALAENIAQALLQTFDKLEAVRLVVRKPEAPVAGIFDYIGVEIYRIR